MTDFLKIYTDAVQLRFSTDGEGATLRGIAVGGMWPDEAPQKTQRPYIIYDLTADEPLRTFNVAGVAQYIEQPGIAFRIYETTKALSLTLGKELMAVYDNVALTVAGFTMIRFDRGVISTFKDPDKEGYVANISYTTMMDGT